LVDYTVIVYEFVGLFRTQEVTGWVQFQWYMYFWLSSSSSVHFSPKCVF